MASPVETDAGSDARLRAGRRVAAALLAASGLLLAAPAAHAGKPARRAAAALTQEHVHPSGAFSFRTPEGWRVEPVPDEPEALLAAGDGLLVRFVYRPGENGYDSLHGACMLERLAPPMETSPRVEYEYDFVDGMVANRRALDSAFIVRYDHPILGATTWRQRNLTIVGEGDSLCLVGYAPLPLWKKSAEARALLGAVLGSVAFR